MKNIGVFLVMNLILLQTGKAQNDLSPALDQLALQYESVYGFSGTILVVENDRQILEQSYGLADRSFMIKNTPDTRNSINSISKTFTAAAILKLVEDGTLDLNTPVGTYLPDLQATWKESVTLHHLLSHTSGLPRESGVQPEDELSFEDQLTLVESIDLLFKPGERYEYSNAGFILLGAIIENASNLPYATYVQENVLSPLELTHSGIYQGRRVVENNAVPYRFTAKGLEFAQRSKHYGDNAGGGLYSTPSDLYRYVIGLEQHKLLSQELTDLLFAPQVESGEGEEEGYGWSIKYFGNEKIYFAAGSGYGTKSVIIRSPESGTYIGITSNWGNTPILNLLRDIYLTLRGQSVEGPTLNGLADPQSYQEYLGTYHFPAEQLKQTLGIDHPDLTLQEFEGKLFLDDELLAEQDGVLMLTYTQELQILFTGSVMKIEISGNSVEGQRIK